MSRQVDTMTVSGVTWDRVEDGEHNQWTTMVGTTRVDVYSDYNESTWSATFNEQDPYDLQATNLQDAMREVLYDLSH